MALITAGMRSRAPWMVLSSVVYGTFAAVPDLALVLDAPVFFFRNEGDPVDEGAGPCAAPGCPWGPLVRSHTGGCLAGVCSEPTTFNARTEVAAVLAGLPAGRQLVTGYYATMHSSLGQPSARYVSRLLQTLALQDGVAGVMTYTLKSAMEPCVGGPLFGDELQHSLGCIVANAYGALAGVVPPAAAAPAAAAAQGTYSAATLALGSMLSALGGALVVVVAAGLAARARGQSRGGGAKGDDAGELGERLIALN